MCTRALQFLLAIMALMQGCNAPQRGILAPPTAAERRAVAESWDALAPAAHNVTMIEQGAMSLAHITYDVRVFEHDVAGNRHETAVLVPTGTAPGSLPILVECPGVRWDYPPRDIRGGPFLSQKLGQHAREFILVEPCLRGHELQVLDTMHHAQGDRRDAYDGATDDASAAISVALAHIPECDGENIFAMGLSRGGTLALLLGERDERVDAVVALSAPVDWTNTLVSPGEDWPQRIACAATSYVGPKPDRAVQFYEWFLQDRAALGDTEVRRRILASSPIHFVTRLPPAQLHYGANDTAVPPAHGRAMRTAFAEHDLQSPTHSVFIHDNAGHLLDGSDAFQLAIEFLLGQTRSRRAD